METCYKDNIIDLYKTILEQETSNHNTFIWVLLGITVVLLGATWLWNKSGAKKYIKNSIAKELKKEKAEIENIVEVKVKEKLAEKSDEINEKFSYLQADVSRSLGFGVFYAKIYPFAIFWFANALGIYIKLDEGSIVRDKVDLILECFNKMGKDKEVHEKEIVIGIIKTLPATLRKEKEEILKLLNESENKPH